jgi:hypothetical protein
MSIRIDSLRTVLDSRRSNIQKSADLRIRADSLEKEIEVLKEQKGDMILDSPFLAETENKVNFLRKSVDTRGQRLADEDCEVAQLEETAASLRKELMSLEDSHALEKSTKNRFVCVESSESLRLGSFLSEMKKRNLKADDVRKMLEETSNIDSEIDRIREATEALESAQEQTKADIENCKAAIKDLSIKLKAVSDDLESAPPVMEQKLSLNGIAAVREEENLLCVRFERVVMAEEGYENVFFIARFLNDTFLKMDEKERCRLEFVCVNDMTFVEWLRVEGMVVEIYVSREDGDKVVGRGRIDLGVFVGHGERKIADSFVVWDMDGLALAEISFEAALLKPLVEEAEVG